MSEILGENLDIPNKEEMNSLAKEYRERVNCRKELRRYRDKYEENREKMSELRVKFVKHLTDALLESPDHAREIVDFASEIWEDSPGWQEGDYRSYIFGTLMERQMEEGLYKPRDFEHVVLHDFSNALKIIERRMRIVKALVDDGYKEFEPYCEFMREARCKLKVWDMTFWMGTEHEDVYMKLLSNPVKNDEYWNDLLVYTTQKTPAEIGGIDRIHGENRITSSYPENPERTYDSIRSGNEIVNEVEAESYKYDLYMTLFISLLERDLEIGLGQQLHHNRLGMFSRTRRTREACNAAQRINMPTILRHNQEVAERVREVINTNGHVLLPDPTDDFKDMVATVMKLFPKYKYEEIEPLPEEGKIDDEINRCWINDYEIVPEYNDDDYQSCELGYASDHTPFLDDRAGERDSTE